MDDQYWYDYWNSAIDYYPPPDPVYDPVYDPDVFVGPQELTPMVDYTAEAQMLLESALSEIQYAQTPDLQTSEADLLAQAEAGLNQALQDAQSGKEFNASDIDSTNRYIDSVLNNALGYVPVPTLPNPSFLDRLSSAIGSGGMQIGGGGTPVKPQQPGTPVPLSSAGLMGTSNSSMMPLLLAGGLTLALLLKGK